MIYEKSKEPRLMNDLLKKLNTLVRANLNTPSLPRFERTPDYHQQLKDLRQRINAALDYEDQLAAKVEGLQQEIAQLDARADEAVAKGQDAEARHLLQQLQRLEQRLTIAEADLRAHQRSAEELIQRVNMLDATVADVLASEAPPPEAAPDSADASSALDRIAHLLNEAQTRTKARIAALSETMHAEPADEETPSVAGAPSPQIEEADVPTRPHPNAPIIDEQNDDDDLAQRLRRLSKPE